MGKVYIVGAGTGRCENLTYKAKKLIETADVILYDRLINPNLLLLSKENCRLIDVGKYVGGGGTTQNEINQMLKDFGQKLKTIVRLKSGDPYIFGRGGEEAIELKAAGIEYEVVPGITSSIGGLTYAGIPATYRDIALDYHLFTGHTMTGEAEYDWKAIASLPGTLVFLMGVRSFSNIVNSLLEAGKSPEKPIAIIEWASRANQKKTVSTLGEVDAVVKKHPINPPSLIVIGEVVNFQDQLNFFENKPLFGKKIGLPQSIRGKMFDQLENLGAEIVLFQSVNVKTIPINNLSQDEISKLVFLDKNAIDEFVKWMNERSLTWRTIRNYRITAVTYHVRDVLLKMGAGFDEFYSTFDEYNKYETDRKNRITLGSKEHLEFVKYNLSNEKVIVTSEEERPEIINIDNVCKADYLVFPNSKAVRSIQNYLKEVEEPSTLLKKPAFCMGEITESRLKKAKFTNIIVSPTIDSTSLFDTIIEYKNKEGDKK